MIDGEEVVHAWLRGPDVIDATEAQLAAWTPLVRGLPVILSSRLNTVVTAQSIVAAQLEIFMYLLNKNALFEQQFGPEIAGERREFAQIGAREARDMFLINTNANLLEEVKEQLRAGQLTIGKLLLLQPGVLVNLRRPGGAARRRRREQRRGR